MTRIALTLLCLLLPAAAAAPLEAKPLQLECQFYSSEDDEPGAPFHYSLDTMSTKGMGRDQGSEPTGVSVVWNAEKTVTIIDESESNEGGVIKKIRDEVVINGATGRASGVLLVQEGEQCETFRATGSCQSI